MKSCLSCGKNVLTEFMNLGETPLANSLLTAEQLEVAEARFPLRLGFCSSCSMVQLLDVIPPEQLFSEYAYFSSFSDAMLAHARTLSRRLVSEHNLTSNSLVLEVASNDGYLLQYYKEQGVRILGVEPAQNIAKFANERGIPTLCEFFGAELAERLAAEARLADVIHANNVLAHVPDINGVVSGFRCALKPNGVVVVEAPYVGDMLDHLEFDTIYHEHIFYFSLTALCAVFARNGLTIFDVERLKIHGGSLRIFAAKDNRGPGESVQRLLQHERQLGLDDVESYKSFSRRVADLREELREFLSNLKRKGARIAAYGASAKGSTLLNYTGIGGDVIDFVVDRSTVKQGHFMPGVHLPIEDPSRLVERNPDYALLLTWNFADEIFEQQEAYLAGGGHFIVPIPAPHVVAAQDVMAHP